MSDDAKMATINRLDQMKRQAEKQIQIESEQREILRKGLPQAILSYRLNTQFDMHGGVGAGAFAQSQLSAWSEMLQRIGDAAKDKLAGRDEATQQRFARELMEATGSSGSAIRNLALTQNTEFQKNYLLATPSTQVLVDEIREAMKQGLSAEEIFSNPYLRSAAKDEPLVQQLLGDAVNMDAQRQAMETTVSLDQDRNAMLRRLLQFAERWGFALPPTTHESGTLSQAGQRNVDARGRINRDGTLAVLHQGEVVLNRRQAAELLTNHFAGGTLPPWALQNAVERLRDPAFRDYLRASPSPHDSMVQAHAERVAGPPIDLTTLNLQGMQARDFDSWLAGQRESVVRADPWGFGGERVRKLWLHMDWSNQGHAKAGREAVFREMGLRRAGAGLVQMGSRPTVIFNELRTSPAWLQKRGTLVGIHEIEHSLNNAWMRHFGTLKRGDAAALQKLAGQLTTMALSSTDPVARDIRAAMLAGHGNIRPEFGKAHPASQQWLQWLDEFYAHYTETMAAQGRPLPPALREMAEAKMRAMAAQAEVVSGGPVGPKVLRDFAVRAIHEMVAIGDRAHIPSLSTLPTTEAEWVQGIHPPTGSTPVAVATAAAQGAAPSPSHGAGSAVSTSASVMEVHGRYAGPELKPAAGGAVPPHVPPITTAAATPAPQPGPKPSAPVAAATATAKAMAGPMTAEEAALLGDPIRNWDKLDELAQRFGIEPKGQTAHQLVRAIEKASRRSAAPALSAKDLDALADPVTNWESLSRTADRLGISSRGKSAGQLAAEVRSTGGDMQAGLDLYSEASTRADRLTAAGEYVKSRPEVMAARQRIAAASSAAARVEAVRDHRLVMQEHYQNFFEAARQQGLPDPHGRAPITGAAEPASPVARASGRARLTIPDAFLEQAHLYTTDFNTVSARSLAQRMGVSRPVARAIIERMEQAGIVGPPDPTSGQRGVEVLRRP